VELAKVKLQDTEGKEALKRAESSLDKGNKALAIRQKHIKITDRSDLSWATVRHYMADPLADRPEDEKEIARSEKEARKEYKQAQAKKSAKRGGGSSGRQRRSRQDFNRDMRFDLYTDYGRRERFAQATYVPQWQPRPRVLGPCWRCGAYGHLHSHCAAPPPPRTYPLFVQPVVSTSAVPVCVNNVSVCGGVDVGSVCVASGVDSDEVTVDSVKVNVINRVTADAMLANAGKGDLFSDGGMRRFNWEPQVSDN